MNEKLAAGAFLVLFFTGAVFMIRQELKNQKQKQMDAVRSRRESTPRTLIL